MKSDHIQQLREAVCRCLSEQGHVVTDWREKEGVVNSYVTVTINDGEKVVLTCMADKC